MTALTPTVKQSQPFYSSADDESVAETYNHLKALLTTREVLRQYLLDRQATVFATLFA